MTVDELQVLITANTNELRKEIGNANKSISGLQKSATKSGNGVKSAFSKLKTGIIALGIGKVIKDSIQSGMDAIESDSLFETSLGASADAVRSWSDEVANVLGLNAVNMRKNTGVIYNMTSSMGVAQDSALKMSKGISLLSEDMASFYNLDSAEAFNKLRAGLTGETEPLKQLGILVDENTIKQVAYSEGIAQNGAELTQQQKVMARYVAILKQTGNAQGDLARTIDSPANQLRILKQQVTNLGIAFSNFLMPVLKAVLPYLSAFTKVITQALNGLSSFLGLTSSGDASKETQKVSDNVGGLAGDYDDATKSAKKLKGVMASFDEMNVLQDKSDSSDTSGGSGATGGDMGFNLDEYDAHLDWVESSTNDIVKKIQDAFTNLGKGIKWDKLKAAFMGVYEAVKPIASKLWSGLKWAWDNILVPLAKWTINDVLPAFLNLTRGALKLLDPILSVVGDAFLYLWDNLLKPLAQWTGGVVVDVLNNLGNALEKVGGWIGDNKDNIDTAPIDALMGSVKSFSGWAIDHFETMGATIGENLSKTWDNISGNLKTGLDNSIELWTQFWTDIQEGIDTHGPAITEGLATLFGSLWEDSVDPALQQASQHWADFTGILAELWNEHGQPLIDNIGQFVTNIIALFQSLWDNVLEPIVTPFLQMLSDVWEKYIKKLVKEVGDFVMTVVNAALEIWNKFIQPVIMWIVEKLKPVFTLIGNVIAKVFGSIIGVISSVITGVIGFFKNIINFFMNVFRGDWDKAWESLKAAFKAVWDSIIGVVKAAWDGIKGVFSAVGKFFASVWQQIKDAFKSVATWFKDIFSKAWEGVKGVFSKVGEFFGGIWDTIKAKFSAIGQKIGDAVSGAFKSAINWVLDKAIGLINGFLKAINFAIGIINKIPGVEIKKIDLLEVPKLARGGIIDKPTFAMVGEAGKEAVMPLERNTGWIDQLADKIGSKLDGVSGNIKLIVKLGEEAIFDRFIEYGKDKAFETNGEVVFI